MTIQSDIDLLNDAVAELMRALEHLEQKLMPILVESPPEVSEQDTDVPVHRPRSRESDRLFSSVVTIQSLTANANKLARDLDLDDAIHAQEIRAYRADESWGQA